MNKTALMGALLVILSLPAMAYERGASCNSTQEILSYLKKSAKEFGKLKNFSIDPNSWNDYYVDGDFSTDQEIFFTGKNAAGAKIEGSASVSNDTSGSFDRGPGVFCLKPVICATNTINSKQICNTDSELDKTVPTAPAPIPAPSIPNNGTGPDLGT